MVYSNSEDIVSLANEFIKKYKNTQYNFFVNYHPMLDFEKLKKKYNFIKKNFTIVKENFNHNYKKFDCVVSNSSSICFESLAHGIPVIIVKSKSRLTHNPISNVKYPIWKVAENENDLKKALDYFLTNKKKSYAKISDIIKKNYFNSVNRESLSKLLGIN